MERVGDDGRRLGRRVGRYTRRDSTRSERLKPNEQCRKRSGYKSFVKVNLRVWTFGSVELKANSNVCQEKIFFLPSGRKSTSYLQITPH